MWGPYQFTSCINTAVWYYMFCAVKNSQQGIWKIYDIRPRICLLRIKNNLKFLANVEIGMLKHGKRNKELHMQHVKIEYSRKIGRILTVNGDHKLYGFYIITLRYNLMGLDEAPIIYNKKSICKRSKTLTSD